MAASVCGCVSHHNVRQPVSTPRTAAVAPSSAVLAFTAQTSASFRWASAMSSSAAAAALDDSASAAASLARRHRALRDGVGSCVRMRQRKKIYSLSAGIRRAGGDRSIRAHARRQRICEPTTAIRIGLELRSCCCCGYDVSAVRPPGCGRETFFTYCRDKSWTGMRRR